MSEQVSQRAMLLEIVLIVSPLSLLFLFCGVMVFILPVFKHATPSAVANANAFAAVLTLFSLVSAWVLSFAFASGGNAMLARRSRLWWIGAWLGIAIVLAACVANNLPPAQEYSSWWQFREDFGLLFFGIPLIIPFVHLVCEARWRKGSTEFSETACSNSPADGIPGYSADSNRRHEPDPPPNTAEQRRIARMTDEQVASIDSALLAHSDDRWRKVAYVVGRVMQAQADRISGIPDVYYAQRVNALAARGALEWRGAPGAMRESEVRRVTSGDHHR